MNVAEQALLGIALTIATLLLGIILRNLLSRVGALEESKLGEKEYHKMCEKCKTETVEKFALELAHGVERFENIEKNMANQTAMISGLKSSSDKMETVMKMWAKGNGLAWPD